MAQSTKASVQQEVSANGMPVQQMPAQLAPAQRTPAGGQCFWYAAGFAWVVWTLAVTAAAHDEWVVASADGISETEGLGPGDRDLLDACDDFDDADIDIDEDIASKFDSVCVFYRWFTAMQFIATVTCSIAVAALAIASFRPANALAKAGSWLMFAYAACQAAAVVLGYFVAKEYDDLLSLNAIEVEPGLTFWLGAVAFVLAQITCAILLWNANHAGNGPWAGAY